MLPSLVMLLLAADSVAVPFIRQSPDFCGEAVVAMALQGYGAAISQDQVFAATKAEPASGRGAHADELAHGLRALGIEPGAVWYRGAAETQWAAIRADLAKGQPSIVCIHYDASPHTTEHFRLVTGFDAATDEVIYQEPAEDDGANRRMKRSMFMSLWPFKTKGGKDLLIRFALPKPVEPVVVVPEEPPTAAQVAQHVMTLKETLPPGSTVVWEKPFLVIGNEPPDTVRDRAKNLIRRERDLLLKDFFEEPPRTLQEVWVLKDKTTYEKYSRELFGTNPETPYGYYLSNRRALVMNIKPGYGTLTHELFHPFFHQAWPDGPAWLNEGVASLFEQPAERDGHYIGKVNWRLPGLLAGLRAKVVPSFTTLAHFDTNGFYADPYGLHYAEARYLCYWLQERGLLSKFVRRAIELKGKDPSGWQALEEVLGADPGSFRKEWEDFTRSLQRGS